MAVGWKSSPRAGIGRWKGKTSGFSGIVSCPGSESHPAVLLHAQGFFTFPPSLLCRVPLRDQGIQQLWLSLQTSELLLWGARQMWLCHGDSPSLDHQNQKLNWTFEGNKSNLILTSPALRKQFPLECKHTVCLGPVLLSKGVTNTQAVCGDGETEAWEAHAIHWGLLSPCPRPPGFPEGQQWAIGKWSPQHPCGSPLVQWNATSCTPSLLHALLSQQPRATNP